ncbi:MAG: YifB family Mg chelatase-like AAA ATPase [Aquificaceae bacterium]|nr:YifB family Mg chelatase-like AAA ATPase [Aquificaceae bacterium]MDW8237578.1 YifB family Mg chelatase-like AAA ATPase [Aquificaceae bacterium]
MFCKVKSSALVGVESLEVDVEVHISPGLMQLNIVGLGDKAVAEAKERVRSALKSCGFELPMRRITINLSPSELKKSGTVFDLPMAVGIISITQNLEVPKDVVFLGELSLDGSVRSSKGLLACVLGMHEKGYEKFVIPAENINECAGINALKVFPIKHLSQVKELFSKEAKFISIPEQEHQLPNANKILESIKIGGIARLAVEACVAGQHHLLMVGPPGSGKSTIAKAIRELLPPLFPQEALEVTRIYSACGLNSGGLIYKRPFRSPHHSSSDVALVGGGSGPQAGEISLAHRGVLFLDELAEFSRRSLETLRQPMEDGQVTISRAEGKVTFPARFTLLAATNPCPCGNYQNPDKKCVCTPYAIKTYQSRISGPLLDRFDMVIWVRNPVPDEKSDSLERINNALIAQQRRFKDRIIFNAHMSIDQTKEHCKLSERCESILLKIQKTRALSVRAVSKTLKLSRTIADMELSSEIKPEHIALALALNTPWTYSSTLQ